MNADSICEKLAQHALRGGGSFTLRVNSCRITAKFKPSCKKVELVSDGLDRFAAADPVMCDTTLRALLRRVEYALRLSPLTPLVDPAINEDRRVRTFITALTPERRTRLTTLLNNYAAFKAECYAGWSAADVEPCLATPRSSLQPCPEMNQCGPANDALSGEED